MDWMPPDLFEDIPACKDGHIRIPDRPGHGMVLQPGAVAKYRSAGDRRDERDRPPNHRFENKIHDDAVARKFAFRRASAGVDVYAYMMHLPVERWGRAFLSAGRPSAGFQPVYDGKSLGRPRRRWHAIAIEGDLAESPRPDPRSPGGKLRPPALGRFPSPKRPPWRAVLLQARRRCRSAAAWLHSARDDWREPPAICATCETDDSKPAESLCIRVPCCGCAISRCRATCCSALWIPSAAWCKFRARAS